MIFMMLQGTNDQDLLFPENVIAGDAGFMVMFTSDLNIAPSIGNWDQGSLGSVPRVARTNTKGCPRAMDDTRRHQNNSILIPGSWFGDGDCCHGSLTDTLLKTIFHNHKLSEHPSLLIEHSPHHTCWSYGCIGLRKSGGIFLQNLAWGQLT